MLSIFRPLQSLFAGMFINDIPARNLQLGGESVLGAYICGILLTCVSEIEVSSVILFNYVPDSNVNYVLLYFLQIYCN